LYDLLKPHVAHVVVCDPRKNALLKAGVRAGKQPLVRQTPDQWYGPDETFYNVCADDGNLYIFDIGMPRGYPYREPKKRRGVN